MSKRTNLLGVLADSRAKGWDPDNIVGRVMKVPTQDNPAGLGSLSDVPDTAGENREISANYKQEFNSPNRTDRDIADRTFDARPAPASPGITESSHERRERSRSNPYPGKPGAA